MNFYFHRHLFDCSLSLLGRIVLHLRLIHKMFFSHAPRGALALTYLKQGACHYSRLRSRRVLQASFQEGTPGLSGCGS